MSRTKRRRGTSSPTIPLCRHGLLNLTCIPGMPTSISIKLAALNQRADAKEPYWARAWEGVREKAIAPDAEKEGSRREEGKHAPCRSRCSLCHGQVCSTALSFTSPY